MNTKNTRAFATQLVLSALVVLGAGGGLGFAVVDLRHDIAVSANNTRLLEQRIVETERLIAATSGAIAAEQSPEILARRNESLALGLVRPSETQVVRVGVSAVSRLAAKRNAEIFAADRGLVPQPVSFNLGGASR
jgi:hypothetical protein